MLFGLFIPFKDHIPPVVTPVPNIGNKSNYEFGQYNVFKSNNFQFNRFYKLIIFSLKKLLLNLQKEMFQK